MGKFLSPTMPVLKEILEKLFFGDRVDLYSHVIPLRGNWYTPTIANESDTATWVGFALSEIKPLTEVFFNGNEAGVNTRMKLYLTSNGSQSLDLMLSTLVWHLRSDVKAEFEKIGASLTSAPHRIFSTMYMQEGQNDELMWSTELTFTLYYEQDTGRKPWLE